MAQSSLTANFYLLLFLICSLSALSVAKIGYAGVRLQHALPDGRGIQVDVYPKELNIREGHEVTVDCRARGSPQPTVRWTRVGGPLPYNARDDNGRLTISNARQEQSGSYVCVATSDGHTVEGFANITIQHYGPVREQRGSGGCMADEKTCRNGECVKADYVCDGEYDCRDQSDEDNCPPPRPCEPNEFKCNNNRCVQKMWVCDGDDDCGDRSDEQNCGTRGPGDVCGPTEFTCTRQQQCVPSSFQCDGQNDCFDGTDEAGCVQPTVTKPPPPGKDVFIGEVIILRCVAVGVPVPHINWRKNWGPVCPPPRCTQTSEDGVGVLTIRDAVTQDSGAYTCEAINTKGRVLAIPDCIVVVQDRIVPNQCNRAGTIPGGRPDARGQCPCKQYATGLLCDQCIAHAFYLHEGAPYGCLRCFCSGVTRDCRSYHGYRTQERLSFSQGNAGGVSMCDFHERRVESNVQFTYPERAMITYRGPFEPTMYFRLPDSLLGDKISAYGGKLKFNLKYTGGRYGSAQVSEPLVVLKGNEITLVYRHDEQLTPEVLHTISIDMYENKWRREDGKEADREHLLMTLADLESILIRASHVQGQESASLGEISLDVAVDRDTQQEQAYAVEYCTCPEGYKGLSCEDCADGYERTGGGLYLGTCQRAGPTGECDLSGSQQPNPGPDGRCICKAYTTGPKCDQCKPNSYYFHGGNPYGCIPCFCSGVTHQCSSSNLYITQERLTFSGGQPVDVRVRTRDQVNPFRPSAQPEIEGRALVFNDFRDVGPSQILYWELPRRFIGDKITSYGSKLKFIFRFSGSGGENDLPAVILRGNDITLYHFTEQRMQPDQDNTLEIVLFENRWVREDRNPSTREHMLMTLADLDVLLIKMTYRERMTSASLTEVVMDYAVERDTQQGRAFAVEQCQCPPGYKGTSCQWCAPGFSRSGGGLYLGLCERCECHGHASECDTEYGYCIDCQHYTEGDRCERCKPGYTGDARRGTPNDCTPVGSPVPCQCYNHSPRGCDRYGRCLFCEHFTEGEHCEKCKRGYYGDATRGTHTDCIQCPCPGERECFLDSDGQVTCKNCPPGFAGRRCENCAPGYVPDPAAVDPMQRCRPYAPGPLQVEIIPPKNIEKEPGETAEWKCVLRGGANTLLEEGNDAYTLAWTRPGYSTLPPNAREADGVLTITDVTAADAGTYKCTASTPTQTASDQGSLSIKEAGHPPTLQINPMVQTLSVGERAEFLCTATGDPAPVLTWGKDRPGGPMRADILQDNGTLVIPKCRLDDQGQYHCTASNKYGTNTAHAELFVSEGDAPPKITIEPQTEWTGEPNDDFEFRCVATGEPLPKVYWRPIKGGDFPASMQDMNNGVLRIRDVQLEDAGEYECVAENLAGSATESVKVDVVPALHVKITPDQDVLRIPEGSPLKLKCEAWGTPEPTWEWVYDVGPCRGDVPEGCTPVVVKEEFITHPKVSVANAGTYECKANNGRLTKSDTIKVEVVPSSGRGVAVIGGESQIYDVGSRVELRCVGTGGFPKNVRWVRVDGELPENAKVVGPGVLVITDFKEEDAGEYECQAFGVSVNEVVSRGKVTIYTTGSEGAVRVVYVDGPGYRVINEGEPLELQCDTTEPFDVTYTWRVLRNGDEATVIGPNNDGLMQIDRVTSVDQGLYQCNVRASDDDRLLGSYWIYIYVQSKGPGVAVLGGQVQSYSVGEAVEMRCVATGGANPDDISWSRIGVDMPDNVQQPSPGVLLITDFQEADQGQYECALKGTKARAYVSLETTGATSGRLVYVDGPSVRVVQQGDALALKCVTAEPDDVRYVWRVLNNGKEPEVIGPNEDGTLTVESVTQLNEGLYQCSVRGEDKTELGTYWLAVVVSFKDTAESVVQDGDAGAALELVCPVYVLPGHRVTWERKEEPLPDKAVVKDGGRKLLLPNFQEEDKGVYVCKVSIGDAFAFGYISASVTQTENIISVSMDVSNTQPELGDTVVFTCNVIGDPSATVTWEKQDGVMPEHAQIADNRLTITNMEQGDEGTYRCLASTTVGPLHADAALFIGSKRKRHLLRKPKRRSKPIAPKNAVFGDWFDSSAY